MGAYLHYSNFEIQLKADLAASLNQRSAIINDFFEKLNKDLTYLSKLDASRQLGSYSVDPSSSRAGGISWEGILASEMLDIANANPSFYRQMSFVTVKGSTWVQVANNNGLITSNFSSNDSLAADPNFNGVQPNRVTIGSIVYGTTTDKKTSATITAFAPVVERFQENKLVGIIVLKINADANLLQQVTAPDIQNNREFRLVDRNGILVDSGISVKQNNPQLGTLLTENLGNIDLSVVGNTTFASRAIQPYGIPDMPWTLVLVDNTSGTVAAALNAVLVIIVIGVVACLLTLFLISHVMHQWLSPLTATRTLAYNLASGQMDETLPPLANDDELGQLTNSFKHISRRMADLSSELEAHVEANQQRLQLVAQLSNEMNGIRSADELLEQVSERLCDEFKFY